MSVINISGLIEEARTYQPDLRALPYAILMDELNRLGIALKQVANIDVITNIERKGGLLRPYSPGMTVANGTEIAKLAQRELKVETAYLSLKDNIKNYQGAKVLNNPQAGTGINQTKEHPLNDLVTAQVVRTATEDVLDALFHAERDTTDLSPLGCFDGYFTIIDDEITAGTIAAANGNLVSTGAINPPADENDVTAINQLVAFVRSADRMLRRYPSLLYMTEKVYNAAIDALENKYKYKDVDLKGLQNYINEKAGAKLTIVVSDALGIGDMIVLTQPGNFDFGMNTFGDFDFVQVRQPYEDPNDIQFWLQADFGTRINSVHKKVFCLNDGTHTAGTFAGDYQ